MRIQRFASVAALLLAAAARPAPSCQPSDAWQEFVAWYKTYTGPPYPGELLKAYAASLAAAGRSEAEVQAALAVVRKTGAANEPEMLRLHFNKVFALHQRLFSQEPNGLLVRTVRDVPPGQALDAGMGQGRNAVFLARLGWDVTGYDLSDEALDQVRRNAAAAGVRIAAVESTHDRFDYGRDRWDLIVMTYSFVNMSDRALLARVKDSLKRGGLIVVEQANSGGEGKGPANALFHSFEDLRVLHYEDVVDVAEWSKQRQRLGRIVVQKD